MEVSSLPKTEIIPPKTESAFPKTGVSVNSIRSIAFKRQLSENQNKTEVDVASLPKESFSSQQLFDVWNRYIEMVASKGEKIQASNLGISNPKLDDDGVTIQMIVPNETIKAEIHREETVLLAYLHANLHNYDIKINVTVDASSENFQKYVVLSQQDKYQMLLEDNSYLEELRRAFNLKFSSNH